MAYGVIYKITCLVNGKIYIGKTTQPVKRRMHNHKCANTAIGNAIRHHGWKNFTVEVIEECDTLEQLNERERFWIAYFNCKSPNGYNLTDGGDGLSSPSAETIAKMKASSKRRFAEHPVTEETLKKRSQTAMRHYDEHPEKRVVASEQMIARWTNPEGRERLLAGIAAYWENPEAHEKASTVAKARSSSPEAHTKFSAMLELRWADPAEHERMSTLMKKIYSDPERLAKQSEASKKYRAEHPYTDEERARISDSVKRYHAEHPESEQTRAKKSMAQKKRHAKKRAVRGLLATLLVAQADTSPEMSAALIRATLEIFSRLADCPA